MGFTDHCALFASVHEDGLNRLIQHVLRQRPSLFHHATAPLAARPAGLCCPVDAHPAAIARGDTLVTVQAPLPVLGSNRGVHFAAQLTDLRLDFHSGGAAELPPELGGSLPAQRFALSATFCAGLACPDDASEHVPPPGQGGSTTGGEPLPVGKLDCFTLTTVGVGHVVRATYNGKEYGEPRLEGLEIVDIAPGGLENSLEAYLTMVLQLAVLPRLRIELRELALDLMRFATRVTLAATPVTAAVPNNPAIEDDLLKVFLDVHAEAQP